MPPSEPVTILIVNDHADEIKLVTISLRGFFPDCRIDVAYSAVEAATMASATTAEWAVVLIDDGCLVDAPAAFVEDLKRRIPYAAILLQSGRTDSASALQALQVGADYFLSKHSPAFLTELLFCTKEALDTSELRRAAERTEIRHRQLVDSLGDIFYELDAEGRFLSVSPNLVSLLGYRPEEVIGLSYLTVFSQSDQQIALFRFNERRSGARAISGFELTFLRKRPPGGAQILITAEVSARGLYSPFRRFLGTVGIIRDLSERKRQRTTIQELRQQLERAGEVRAIAQQIAALSKELQQPLSTLQNESRLLLETIREARVVDRLGSLSGHAAAATQLGKQLEHLVHETSRESAIDINRLLENVLMLSTEAGLEYEAAIVTDFAASLPAYKGDRERTIQLFQRLIDYARTYLEAVKRPRILIIRTSGVGPLPSVAGPTLFPLAPSRNLDIEILETGRHRPAGAPAPSLSEPIDLLDLYQRARELGASLDVSAPAAGPLRLAVRLPVEMQPPLETAQPPAAAVSPSPLAAETPVSVQPPIIAPSPVEPVKPDRRNQPRISTTLPAHVTLGSSAWEGTLNNLSLGGACLTLPSNFPSIALQEAYIVMRTAVGILELTGLVYERADSIASQATASIRPHIVIVFHPPRHTEAAVLASLIDAARERSLGFTLEVFLAAGPPERKAAGPKPVPDAVPDHDRREALRVSLALPLRLETVRHQEPASRLVAQMMNLSRDGACLLVKERPEQIRGLVLLHFAPAFRTDQPGSHEPGAPETALPAQIVWSAPDPMAPSTLHPSGTSHASRVGVRFLQLTPHAEREIHRVIRQHLNDQRTADALSASASVVTVPRECRNARGQAIAIADDHLGQTVDADMPTVILAPGFGQTALDYAALSYYLAAHHLRLLRYDHTNHVGTSEGELQHATMRSLQHDLLKVVEFVSHTWPKAPVLVVASDVAARAALKMAAQARPLDLLLLINPSLDVGAMLMAMHGHDLIADYRFGLRRGIANLMGLNVDIDRFVGDLIAGHYSDLESTLDDLRLIRSPLGIVTCPTPALTGLPPGDLSHAFVTALGAKTRLVNLPTSLTDHLLSAQEPYPAAFARMLDLIVSVLPVRPKSPGPETTVYQQFSKERRVEQEYTCLRHEASHITREALCAAHLSQLPQFGNLHEYRKLLDDLYGLMSPLNPGAILVDAGIGQGDLTRAALVNHTYRAGQTSWTGKPSPLMIGVARSAEMIGEARHAVQTLQRELSAGFIGRLAAMPPLNVGWIQADWSISLPFKTGSLDRLVCNLSLPYVPSPLAALREWHRVLHPEGRLVLTTFHPHTDLSMLYRRHLRQANQDEFNTQAQPLLHYFGRLREAICHRLLHTFDRPTLSSLLRQAGMTSFRILPIFDGQALVAVVGKENSSSSIQ
ncbi:MAG TPA: PAS domain S-box protein [Nitrospira sp.]|nr:PAS domain S-box protein [Nitrospira sp.]